MPLSKGTRYRVKTARGGSRVRLAFAKGSNRVIEAKNIDTGATHSPRQFSEDRKRRRQVKTRRR